MKNLGPPRCRLARRLRAGDHGDADVGLCQRGRVVGAVAAHGDELAFGLLVANEAQLSSGVAAPRNRRRRLPPRRPR